MKNSTIFTFTVLTTGLLVFVTLREEKKAFRLAPVIPVAAVETSQVAEISKPFEVQTRAPSSIAHTTSVSSTQTRATNDTSGGTSVGGPAPTQVQVASETATDATTLHFHLSDEILGTMEHAGAELRQYASAEPTGAGWRIELYPADKIFAKAGFHNGQIITLAELQVRSDDAEQGRLAQRMVDVLRMIER
jgi:hypothetical protein